MHFSKFQPEKKRQKLFLYFRFFKFKKEQMFQLWRRRLFVHRGQQRAENLKQPGENVDTAGLFLLLKRTTWSCFHNKAVWGNTGFHTSRRRTAHFGSSWVTDEVKNKGSVSAEFCSTKRPGPGEACVQAGGERPEPAPGAASQLMDGELIFPQETQSAPTPSLFQGRL